MMRLQESIDDQLADTPERIYEYLVRMLPGSLRFNQDVENFMVVLLNVRQRVIGLEVVSNGALNQLLVHARETFKPAILLGAHAIVLAHNHPSGDPTPSESDIRITRDLVRAGQTLRIEVLDHIIIGRKNDECPDGFMSLRRLGYLVPT